MSSWTNELKIALINEDIDGIERLIVSFKEQNFNRSELIEASALVSSSIKLLEQKREYIKNEVSKLKNVQRYMN